MLIIIYYMDKKIFRAYDIRGVYPVEIDENLFYKIGQTLGNYFQGRVALAFDARLGSVSLADSLEKGLQESGKTEVLTIGLATTPMLYFLIHQLNLDGGVMVTASHNPKEYNGLKVLGRQAIPISGEKVYELLRKLH